MMTIGTLSLQEEFLHLGQYDIEVLLDKETQTLTHIDPLAFTHPILSYQIYLSQDIGKGCLTLCKTYIKWTVFYSIHIKRKIIDGNFVFDKPPTDMILGYAEYLDSFYIQAKVDGKWISYLVSNNRKAKEFETMWNCTQGSLARLSETTLYFNNEQAMFVNADGEEFTMISLDSEGVDSVITYMDKGNNKSQYIVAEVNHKIRPQKLIQLDRSIWDEEE